MRSCRYTLVGFVLVLVLVLGQATPGEAETELDEMQPNEIRALQSRLTDDFCYKGPINGQATAETDFAIKTCPDQTPVLRIETGMHLNVIQRVGVDSACHQLVTASDDKTVRVWSLPEGVLVRTIRLPIGPGNDGKIFAMALSPNGNWLAAGGWDAVSRKYDHDQLGHGLYVVDLAGGDVRRLSGSASVIHQIAISPDGERIGLGLHKAIRVLSRSSGRELFIDRNYGDSVYGMVFTQNGDLLTAGNDGFLRRYSSEGHIILKVKAPRFIVPQGIALSPDSQNLAVSAIDSTNVAVFDANSLKFKYNTDMKLLGGFRSAVAWTFDGKLVAGGTTGSGSVLRRFDENGGSHISELRVSDNTVMDIKSCGSNLVFGTADPSFGTVDSVDAVRILQSPVTADMRKKLGYALQISDDASIVRFGLSFGAGNAVRFDLLSATLSEDPTSDAHLQRPNFSGLPVSDWENSFWPKFDRSNIALRPNELSRALAVSPYLDGFVLGTDFGLWAFDAKGKPQWSVSEPAVAWGVNISSDGRIVVVASGDGTIRWHRRSDGKELLALFVHAPTKRWVAWTPTGYYIASPGGEDLIGWHLNRGWNQEADFFPASRFRERFNRPDIVQMVLKIRDETEAVRQANDVARKHIETEPLIGHLPPIITILSPTDGLTIAPGTLEVRYQARLPSGGTIDRVEAFVDGAKMEVRGLAPVAQATAVDGIGVLELPMPDHDVTISLVAFSSGIASDAARLRLKGVPPTSVGPSTAATDDGLLKPNLYALLVGVTHYENHRFDLEYAAKDAVDLATALKAQEGKLYRHVEVKVLTDRDATASGVKRGLNWLSKQTTARDLAIVFASGHGLTDAKGRFWFLTEEFDPDDLRATAVSQDDLLGVLFDLPGKKLMLLDACHSGAALSAGVKGLQSVDVSAAINEFAQAEGGVVAYAASTAHEVSLERPEWGHGAFTKALIEGLGGRADLFHKGTITTATLDAYLADRVKELTGGLQHPVMTRPKTVPDFPIASVQ